MIFYIPIRKHVDILPMDMLKSPRGNHYQVICDLGEEVLKLSPLDIIHDASNMEFRIFKHKLIEGGWKKGMR
jgi:hypothetical protein